VTLVDFCKKQFWENLRPYLNEYVHLSTQFHEPEKFSLRTYFVFRPKNCLHFSQYNSAFFLYKNRKILQFLQKKQPYNENKSSLAQYKRKKRVEFLGRFSGLGLKWS